MYPVPFATFTEYPYVPNIPNVQFAASYYLCSNIQSNPKP